MKYKDFVYFNTDKNVFVFKKGWALAYVLARKPLSEEFRDEFYNELVDENETYRHALEQAIRQHGVRWV